MSNLNSPCPSPREQPPIILLYKSTLHIEREGWVLYRADFLLWHEIYIGFSEEALITIARIFAPQGTVFLKEGVKRFKL